MVVGYFTSALSVILHSTTAVNQTGTIRFLAGGGIQGLTTCATMQKFLNLSKGIASILLSSCAVAFAELARSDVENSWAVAGVGHNDSRACVNEVVPGRPRGRRSLLIKVHCRIGRVGLVCTGGCGGLKFPHEALLGGQTWLDWVTEDHSTSPGEGDHCTACRVHVHGIVAAQIR